MPSSEASSVELSPETADLVRDAVSAGRFPDAATMVEAAVRNICLDLEDDLHGYTPEELTRLIDEGIASGPGQEVDFQEIMREGRLRSAAARRDRAQDDQPRSSS